MAHHLPFQVLGFHSCDKEVGMRIINGGDQLKPSKNPWDWLGEGVYFWEHNPEKSLEYSIKCALNKQKFAGEINTPFVIGAIIELGNCLNLVEPQSLKIVKAAYNELKVTTEKAGKNMPVNNGSNRRLDCAVIQSIHESNRRELENSGNGFMYDTVRSPFHEGLAVYEGSNFTEGLHIEIAVLNTSLIRGYFLPLPIEQYNPYLNKDFDKNKAKKEYSHFL
ncbi:MAG TPA: hypothetical protein VG847_16340 [Chitinophagaceae bacterium]|nr:hypothetical protein [Chitinophagaceae bacterium]